MLVRVNQGLVSILEQAGAAIYATGFYMVVDVHRGELRYSTAGHPSPFLIRRATALAEPLHVEGIGGPALGIFKDATYGTARCPLSIGDLIMMFTDGIFEVEGSEGGMFSEKDLLSTVQRKMSLPPKEFLDEVVGEVRAFSSSHSFDDDVCLIGVEVHNVD
jgi:sigma-B regulation protein RsbU (phosphoserine phosphatase)